MPAEPEPADEPACNDGPRSVPHSPQTALVLIGYRGTGKSTVARHLANALGWDWLDADVELERRAGKSISDMFADDGEPAFRDLESRVLEAVVRRERCVIAAGGGVVLKESNRRVLRNFARVVWLQASPATIIKRISADAATSSRRPNLTVGGGTDEVVQLLAERAPLYRRCADLEVDADNRPPEEIAAEIVRRLRDALGMEPA